MTDMRALTRERRDRAAFGRAAFSIYVPAMTDMRALIFRATHDNANEGP
tara:strand:+ start:202 stop:348 length:147 start_codon:yes stop_codon:yes gene_type:complete